MLGAGIGLATGLVVALFPCAATGGGLVAATTASARFSGAVAGHTWAGRSRDDPEAPSSAAVGSRGAAHPEERGHQRRTLAFTPSACVSPRREFLEGTSEIVLLVIAA
jgi:hypothetical protein